MIKGDWGSTHLRLLRIRRGEQDRLTGPGIARLTSSPAETLAQVLSPWAESLSEGVLLCGMAGSQSGLHPTPYIACPADVGAWSRGLSSVPSSEYPTWIAAGLSCQNFADQPDVMRGEEAQIFGALELDPSLASGTHCLVLPGTHSKWAIVRDAAIIRFQTFLTGELFAILTTRSSLLIDREKNADDGQDGFTCGLGEGGANPLASLFSVRTAQLVGDRSREWARGYLSGILLAAEMAEAVRLTGLVDEITLIGDEDLVTLYQAAAAHAGIRSRAMDGQACVMAGLDRLAGFIERIPA